MKTETDILIDDLRRQKPAALGRLFAEHGPTVFRMVQRIVPGREDAEEVYQDVFVKALRGIMSFDPKKATLSTWLCRIAYNESLNFVRRRKPNLVYMDDSKLGSDSFEVPEDAPIDEEIIVKAAKETKGIVTAEEHSIIGGLGRAVAEVTAKNAPAKIRMIGMQDRFGQSGKPDQLMAEHNLTADDIVKACKELL